MLIWTLIMCTKLFLEEIIFPVDKRKNCAYNWWTLKSVNPFGDKILTNIFLAEETEGYDGQPFSGMHGALKTSGFVLNRSSLMPLPISVKDIKPKNTSLEEHCRSKNIFFLPPLMLLVLSANHSTCPVTQLGSITAAFFKFEERCLHEVECEFNGHSDEA